MSLGMSKAARIVLSKLRRWEAKTYYELARELGLSVPYIHAGIKRLKVKGCVKEVSKVIGDRRYKAFILTEKGEQLRKQLSPEATMKGTIRDTRLLKAFDRISDIRVATSCFNLCYDADQGAGLKRPADYRPLARRMSVLLSASKSMYLGVLVNLYGDTVKPSSLLRAALMQHWAFGFRDPSKFVSYVGKSEAAGLTEADALLSLSPAKKGMNIDDVVREGGKYIKENLRGSTKLQIWYALLYDIVSHELLTKSELKNHEVIDEVGSWAEAEARLNDLRRLEAIKMLTDHKFLVPGRVYRYYPETVQEALRKVGTSQELIEVAEKAVKLGAFVREHIAPKLPKELRGKLDAYLKSLARSRFLTVVYTRKGPVYIPIWSHIYRDIERIGQELLGPGMGLAVAISIETWNRFPHTYTPANIFAKLAKEGYYDPLAEVGDDKELLAIVSSYLGELSATGLVTRDPEKLTAYRIDRDLIAKRIYAALKEVDLSEMADVVDAIKRIGTKYRDVVEAIAAAENEIPWRVPRQLDRIIKCEKRSVKGDS